MNPSDNSSLKELESFLYELRDAGSKYSLSRIAKFLDALGNPQETYPTIHVAGTNGKGSVCAMLESILRACSLKTGMFTSPHLVYLGERVQINRNPISKSKLYIAVQDLRALADKLFSFENKAEYPSFFEYMTALAFNEFAQENIDVAVVEVGLGGRLDSTNILKSPELCVISSIGLDHTAILGDKIEYVAREKAGIIKKNVPVVCGWLPDEAMRVIEDKAKEMNAPLYKAEDFFADEDSLPRVSLKGFYQRRNGALAKLCAEILKARAQNNQANSKFLNIEEDSISRALLDVKWDARWQEINLTNGGMLILDSSHNEEGARVLDSNLKEFCKDNPKPIIAVGVLGLERAASIMGVVEKYASKIILLKPGQARALDFEVLKSYVENKNLRIESSEVKKLFPREMECAEIGGVGETIICTGSIYLAGEVLSQLTASSFDALQDNP